MSDNPRIAMIGSGYIIVKKNIIDGKTINGLILIVFWLFLPAFIFTKLLSADIGSKAKKGEINEQRPIDPVKTALAMGCTFVARGFSGDKDQLLPMLKAGLKHDGFAMIDVLSPCVTFNDHEDSTKSYAHTRQFYHPAVHADFIPPAEPIRAGYDEGKAVPVQLHDGSQVLLRKVAPDYDPHDRAAAISYLERHEQAGEIVTGQ